MKITQKSHILAIMCLSFSSGLPFLLIVSTLPIWLKEVDCSLKQISYIFLISLPYSIKFLWAPLLDQLALPSLAATLGQRRSWLLLAQLALFSAIIALACTDPKNNIHLTAFCAFLVTLFAATQDIALDAYRIERLSKAELGVGTSFSGVGFRLGMLVAGGGSIYLGHEFGWRAAYTIMACLTLIGPCTTLLVREPDKKDDNGVANLYAINGTGFLAYLKNVVRSFINITRYDRWQYILLFIFLFKISDAIPNSMNSMFFLDLGFTVPQLGDAKSVNILMTILGTCMGGLIASKFKIVKCILYCGFAQMASPLILYGMSFIGHNNEVALLASQCVQGFVCGLGTTVLVIYLSSLCSGGFTATQFAVIYSFSSIARIILSASAGWIVQQLHLSWATLFFWTTIVSISFIIPALKLNGKSLAQKEILQPATYRN